MEISTAIIFLLLTAALAWWFTLQFAETKKQMQELRREMKESLLRAERIKRLLNK